MILYRLSVCLTRPASREAIEMLTGMTGFGDSFFFSLYLFPACGQKKLRDQFGCPFGADSDHMANADAIYFNLKKFKY